MSKNLDNGAPHRYYQAAEKDIIVDDKKKTDDPISLEVDNFRKSGITSSDMIRRRALETLEWAEKSGQRIKYNESDSTKSFKIKGAGESYASINASDLRVENTIILDQTPANKQQLKSLPFEPNEITGRSTLCSKKYSAGDHLSVEAILTSSFVGNVRNLCDSLRELNNSCAVRETNCGSSRYSSLPRTSDMSRNMSRKTNLDSFYGGDNTLPKTKNDRGLSTENFIPAELMNSKLDRDELEWRNQFAEIPEDMHSSLTGDDNCFGENMSRMTNFFRQRCENLSSIIDSVQQTKNDDVAVSLTDNSRRSALNFNSKNLKNDNVNTQQLDSDNSISLLSMSTIEKVLAKISCGVDFDPVKILKDAKLSTNNNNNCNKKCELSDMENKENVKAYFNLCDTKTFTESLLESTALKDLNETEKSLRKGSLNNLEERNSDMSTMKTSRKRSSKNVEDLNEYNSPSKKDKINLFNENVGSNAVRPQNELLLENIDPNSLSTKLKTAPPNLNSLSSLGSPTSSDNQYLAFGYPSNSSSPISSGQLSLPNYALGPKKNLNTSPYRSNSQCSGSSEFNHNNGSQLPIKVDKTELTWGSTKLRKNSKNSLIIKNCSAKRLYIRIAATGAGFQVLNDEEEFLKLMPQECRKVYVVFSPTAFGTAVGILHFTSPSDTKLNKSLKVMLYGYGGHAKIILKGAVKGPVGAAFITLGELSELSDPLVKYFTIHNDGPLDGFVTFLLDSNGLNGLNISKLKNKVKIEPPKAIIPAAKSIKFKITFEPSRNDLQRIIKKLSPVMTVANLRILNGDEPTRQRIREILSKLNDDERKGLSTESLDPCWQPFVGEKRLDELSRLKEKADVVEKLFSSFKIVDWLLTLNYSNFDDNTLSSTNFIFPDSDETVMFRTIIESNSKKSDGNDVIDLDCADSHLIENWSVRPNSLTIDLTCHRKTKATFQILNAYKDIKFFEIRSNYRRLFVITPNTGKLLPSESINIEVRMSQMVFPSEEINIEVYMENEKIVLPVTFLTQHPF